VREMVYLYDYQPYINLVTVLWVTRICSCQTVCQVQIRVPFSGLTVHEYELNSTN